MNPDAVVLVATCRALKYHGGVAKDDLMHEDVGALKEGLKNLGKHIENIKDKFGLNVIVAINKFSGDTKSEIGAVKEFLRGIWGRCDYCPKAGEKGGAGMTELAQAVKKLTQSPKEAKLLYESSETIEAKIEKNSCILRCVKGGIYRKKLCGIWSSFINLGCPAYP